MKPIDVDAVLATLLALHGLELVACADCDGDGRRRVRAIETGGSGSLLGARRVREIPDYSWDPSPCPECDGAGRVYVDIEPRRPSNRDDRRET